MVLLLCHYGSIYRPRQFSCLLRTRKSWLFQALTTGKKYFVKSYKIIRVTVYYLTDLISIIHHYASKDEVEFQRKTENVLNI